MSGEHEQRSEDELQRTACRPRVEQCAGQTAGGAREAEAPTTVQSTSRRNRQKRIDVPMRGEGTRRQPRAWCPHRSDGRRQQTADAEACDRRDGAAEKSGTQYQELKHWKIGR